MPLILDEKTLGVALGAAASVGGALYWLHSQLVRLRKLVDKIENHEKYESRLSRLEATVPIIVDKVGTLWHREGLSEPQRPSSAGSEPDAGLVARSSEPMQSRTVAQVRRQIVDSVPTRPESVPTRPERHRKTHPTPIRREDPDDPDSSGE